MIAEFLGEAIILPAELADGMAECAARPHRRRHRRAARVARIMLRPEQVAAETGIRVTTVGNAGTQCCSAR